MTHYSHQFTVPAPYRAYCCNHWPCGQTMAMHRHDCLQIYHVIAGDFQVDTGDGWQRILPGHAHILPPGFQHALRAGKNDLHFSVTFGTGDDERGLTRRIIAAHPRPGIQLVPLPAHLQNCLRTTGLLLDEMTQLRLILAFDSYCMNLLTQPGQNETEVRKQKLFGYLESKNTETVTVEQIADALHMSRTSLQRFCAEHFHCGIKSLHERVRVANASRLLLASEMSISQCARTCGYANIYSFSRIFKRVKGRSPQNFRRHSSQTDC